MLDSVQISSRIIQVYCPIGTGSPSSWVMQPRTEAVYSTFPSLNVKMSRRYIYGPDTFS